MTEKGPGEIVLTMAPGWETVLPQPQHDEDDPGLLIMWDLNNLATTATNFNKAVAAGAVAPAFLGGGASACSQPFTVSSLQMSLLKHIVQTAGGSGGGVIGNALIAPPAACKTIAISTMLQEI
jgi:hypothetical protein